MTTIAWRITGGVDTHLDVHVAAALDERGALLGVESFATTAAGYRRLFVLARELRERRARRRRRHRQLWRRPHKAPVGPPGCGGRGRPAQPPAPSAQGQVRSRRRRRCSPGRPRGRGHGVGQGQGRNVEAMRVLRVARFSARGSRTQAINQMRSLISTAPDELRAELRDLSIYKILTVTSA